ncbi:MAG: glycosyltransferase family 4 protein [Ignavibacteriales bacterium]|nr:glycosyltransferase family 4 protein [Ignavibacteriales bacterium]
MAKALKILMINKYYFVKGGSESYFFELKEILEKRGHKVIPFSMQHPNNYHTEFKRYFVNHIDFNHSSLLKKLIESPRITGRIIYSWHSRAQIEKLINKHKPDIAHLHMIDHQISPSILDSLNKYGIPVIQTVHQYKLICPNYLLYIPYKNQICEKCINGVGLHPIFEKCHKNSRLFGAILVLENIIHRRIKIYNKVNFFHAPSEFMKNKLIAGGIPAHKILKHFYTIKLDDFPFYQESNDLFVYLGRLTKEKGVLTLLKAMVKLRRSQLIIVGDGPQRSELEKFMFDRELKNVMFVGNKTKQEVRQILAKAKFVVVPSEWYDNSPLVIYESFAMGKPVIGSDLGGISELIDGTVGLKFEAGNVDDLYEKMLLLLNSPKLTKEFGLNARKKAERMFDPNDHYQWLHEVYQNMLIS